MSGRGWDNVPDVEDDLDPDEYVRLLAHWRAKSIPMLDRRGVPDADQFEIRRVVREIEDKLVAAGRGFRDGFGLFVSLD